MSQYDRGIKYLNHFSPTVKGLLPAASSSTGGKEIGSLKSENPVKSTVEEQRLLMALEDQLVSNEITEKLGKPVEDNRWLEAAYPSAASLSDSAFFEVSKVILCSNGLHDSSNSCDGIKEIVKDSLYGVKTDSRIIFGFRMRLEATPASASQFRIKLHEHFRKTLWPVIKKRINFNSESREIIFVGYESGGALASLAAWMTVKHFEMLKPAGIIVNNGNNQVKVITWDELPLFTQGTASKSPILPRNHSRFNSSSIGESIYRQIAQMSGGIDEINYFATSGDRISLKSADYNDFLSRLSVTEKVYSWNPASYLPQFIKEKRLEKLSQERLEKLSEILILHRKHLSILHNLISNNYRIYMADVILSEPNSCASALSQQLSISIFSGSKISCRVDGFKSENGTFQIICSYQTTWTSSQFLTFDAVLGDEKANKAGNNCFAFMEEVEYHAVTDKSDKDNKTDRNKKKTTDKKTKKTATKAIGKALVYTGPAPISDTWSNCIYDLFEQQLHLSLISPFALKNNKIYPRCSYTPFASNSFITTKNTGCYLRAPNVAHELLQVYKSDPSFFYKAVDPKLMKFPTSCKKVLFHIPFKATERAGLESLQQVAVEYLTQLVSKNPMADSKVTFWYQRDTESFKTLAFLGTETESITEDDLAEKSNFENDFENSIIKCLSNPSYPYRDCTNPQNRWVPMACPAACYQTHGAINFLCKQVKSCPVAGYYISVANEGTLKQVSDIHEQLNSKLNPQFGIYHVQTKGRSHLSYFKSAIFNVALFRLPTDR